MQMKTTSIACISGDHQKTKLLIINNYKILNTLRAGFDTFSATFPSLSITAFKDGIKCLFPDMGDV